MLTFGSLLLLAYLLGSVPAAYLTGKIARGIDLRQYGSGNVGFTNLVKATSLRIALPALLFDLGKGMLVVYIARASGLPGYQQLLIGLAAAAGHSWPVFLNFNAGRGILTTLGFLFAFEPRLTLALMAAAFLGLPFKQFALSTIIVLFVLPLLGWLAEYPVISALFTQPVSGERLQITLAMTAILLVTVVRRLTAPRSELAVTVSSGELLLNRLLFDRDIRSREAWLRRKPLLQKCNGSNEPK